MTQKKSSKKGSSGKVRWKPGVNQFGKPLARALIVTAPVYQCSACGATMFPDEDGNAPVRCSNRKGCGRIFYEEK
jgi:DNA-directed RNA polymerase subunit RPC12/RpoP